jgi:acyl carrier protein
MRQPVTTDDIRQILAEERIFGEDTDALTDDAELVLDSLAAVWLQHVLAERHGIHLVDEDMEHLNSIARICEYASRLASMDSGSSRGT